jgi:hypothetical protein
MEPISLNVAPDYYKKIYPFSKYHSGIKMRFIMTLPCWFNWTYGIVSLCFILFYGYNAFEVFSIKEIKTNEGVNISVKQMPLAWRFHQFWFNVSGSAIGWSAGYYLAWNLWNHNELGILDVSIFLIFFIGITGHLPYATMGIIQGLGDLFLKGMGLGKNNKQEK